MSTADHLTKTGRRSLGTRSRATPGFRLALATGLIASMLVSVGCQSTRYLSLRRERENPLAAPLQLMTFKGPRVSERAWSTMRRYGLHEGYQENAEMCLAQIRQTIAENRDPELIHALAELSYVEGKKAESRGQAGEALGHFGMALTSSYNYLFAPDLDENRNLYDPQFRATCDVYNESLEDMLRLLCKDHKIRPGQTYHVETADGEFEVETRLRGNWNPDEFDHYEFVSDYKIQTLRARHTTFGLGVPLIAVRKKGDLDSDSREKHYPDGLSYAVTALIRCDSKKHGEGQDYNRCILEFFDPLSVNEVRIANHWVPLETDLTTPLAYYLDKPQFRTRNIENASLFRPGSVEQTRGLYMLEPYDPDRIPVLMVHGLWSSPRTWMDMFNDLRSFPELRERYQFWFYLYPSGQPFWISATQLREDLRDIRDRFDPGHRDAKMDQMVLVGHSMGGLISRLQTIDSGDDFWRIVSDQPSQRLKGDSEQRNRLVSTLFFKPNQSIQRVVTIGTPHRGSEFANDLTRWLARKLIKLPSMTVSTTENLVRSNPDLFRDTDLLTMSTSVDSLAPDSPIFPVMLRAQYAPEVRFHNIVGVLENPNVIQKKVGRGDGVVAYESATMPDTESELIVDAEHTVIHTTGQAIFEVRRILLEHLAEIDAKDRYTSTDPPTRITVAGFQEQPETATLEDTMPLSLR